MKLKTGYLGLKLQEIQALKSEQQKRIILWSSIKLFYSIKKIIEAMKEHKTQKLGEKKGDITKN